VVTNHALVTHAGLLASALLPAGSALSGANFLPLFHLGLLAEDLLLLLGCWMLARRFFSSPYAAFVVGVAAVGSAFAYDHAWLNVHSVFALPLLVELLHGALETGSRRKLFLAGNLAAIQALGAPPGAGLAAPLAALVYFAGRAYVLREPLLERIRGLGWTRRDLLPLAGVLLTALPVLLTAFWATGDLRSRSTAGGADARDILVYAGLSNLLRYADLLLGTTPSLDWSLYCGGLTVGLAIVGLLSSRREAVLRLAVALLAGLFALGLCVFLFTLAAPSLRPIPAPPFGTPVLRLVVVFLAGLGIQRLVEERRPEASRVAGRILFAASLLLALLSWAASMQPDSFRSALSVLVAGEPASSTATPALEPGTYRDRKLPSVASDLVGMSALTAALSGGILLAWGARPRVAPLALTLLLFLHPLDVFGWKFRMSWLETFPANTRQRELQRLEPARFPARRVASLNDVPRFAAFHAIARGWADPSYVPREDPAALAPGYWGADLAAPAGPEWMHPWDPGMAEPAGGERLQFFSAAQPVPEDPRERRLDPKDRRPLSYAVLAFHSDDLKLQVHAPGAGGWLLYADVWAEAWLATVNGTPREIAKGNGVYKAIPLDAGVNLVEFRYRSPLRTASFFIVGANALLWLLWAIGDAVRRAAWGGTP
jgi:hypothetical protein